MLIAATLGRVLVAFSALAIALFFGLVDPVPQDPAYHLFADTVSMLGVANFLNVVTNLPFLLIGIYGLLFIIRNPATVDNPDLRWPWVAFFAGITLTAFGSSWFHLAPSNDTLAWDRLPMTLGFAGLFAIVIGEYLQTRCRCSASVFYWQMTESTGSGDLRPYAVVQFLPVMLIPALLILRRNASDLTGSFWLLTAFYISAKLFEHFDNSVYNVLSAISGHSLKHLVAALSPAVLILALHRRLERPTRLAHD